MPAVLLSIFTILFVHSSSVALSYFLLAVLMRKCLEEHSCTSSSFSIATLSGTYFFSRSEIVLVFLEASPIKLSLSSFAYQASPIKLRLSSFAYQASPIKLTLSSLPYQAYPIKLTLSSLPYQAYPIKLTLSSFAYQASPIKKPRYNCYNYN